jgi:hypothetical protein
MRKLTSTDLLVLKYHDVLAKYPLDGVASAFNMIDEREVKSSVDLWAIVSISLVKQECVLGRTIFVLHASCNQKIIQKFSELLNGLWWTEINTKIFSDELLYS